MINIIYLVSQFLAITVAYIHNLFLSRQSYPILQLYGKNNGVICDRIISQIYTNHATEKIHSNDNLSRSFCVSLTELSANSRSR